MIGLYGKSRKISDRIGRLLRTLAKKAKVSNPSNPDPATHR